MQEKKKKYSKLLKKGKEAREDGDPGINETTANVRTKQSASDARHRTRLKALNIGPRPASFLEQGFISLVSVMTSPQFLIMNEP